MDRMNPIMLSKYSRTDCFIMNSIKRFTGHDLELYFLQTARICWKHVVSKKSLPLIRWPLQPLHFSPCISRKHYKPTILTFGRMWFRCLSLPSIIMCCSLIIMYEQYILVYCIIYEDIVQNASTQVIICRGRGASVAGERAQRTGLPRRERREPAVALRPWRELLRQALVPVLSHVEHTSDPAAEAKDAHGATSCPEPQSPASPLLALEPALLVCHVTCYNFCCWKL